MLTPGDPWPREEACTAAEFVPAAAVQSDSRVEKTKATKKFEFEAVKTYSNPTN